MDSTMVLAGMTIPAINLVQFNNIQQSMIRLNNQVSGVSQTFSKAAEEAKKTIDPIDLVGKKLFNLAASSRTFKEALDLMWNGLKIGDNHTKQENQIQASVGNEKLGSDIYKILANYAKSSVLNRDDLVKGFDTFNPKVQNLNEMTRLFGLVERLVSKNSAQGSTGAITALKSAMNGDTQALESNYGIQISGQKTKDLFSSGDTAGGLEYMDEQLAAFGATQELVEGNMDTLTTKLSMFSANLQDAFGGALQAAAGPITDFITVLSVGLETGRFQPFFDMFIQGALAIGQALLWVSDNITWLGPLIMGLCGAFLAYSVMMGVVSGLNSIFALSANVANGSLTALNGTFVVSSWWIIPLLMGLLAAAAAFGLFNDSTKDLGKGITDQESFDKTNAEFTQSKATDVNVINEEPLAISGDVQIEEDNLSYMMDLANRDYIAKFSTATLAPQMNVSIGQVNQSADINGLSDQLASELNTMITNEAEGSY